MRILKINKATTFLVGIMMMTILLCCSSSVQAADGDYTYTVTAGKAQITGYSGVGGVVTIPGTLGGAPVTSIGNYAFFSCSDLISVSIPQGVTTIGGAAFGVCRGLTSITIPQGVTNIGNSAFIGCSALSSISIPQGVTNLSQAAFANCTGLSTITFNSATTTIYSDAGTIPATTKIIGYDPSGAKNYATKYGRTFEVIGGSTKTLQSLAITTSATKLSYNIGDNLDITGLVVTGTYSDGSTAPESITAANVTGFNSAVAAADQVLTITVSGQTVTYKVQVVAVTTNPLGKIPVGTVIFSNGQALDLGYANNSSHMAEVTQDVIRSGRIYVITFTGQVINNSTGAILTDLSSLPAVTYKDAHGNVKQFAQGDGPEVL